MSVREGMKASKGDWRVLLLLNFILSLTFGYLLILGLSIIGVVSFGWTTVAAATLIIMALTYLVTH